MGFYNLVIPRESAWNVMNELAELDCIHFIDPDPGQPVIARPFANYIKRSDDLLHKLDVISQEVVRYNKPLIKCKDVHELILYLKNTIHSRPKASHTFFEDVEQDIDKRYTFLSEQLTNLANLQDKKNSLIENKAVLHKGSQILGQSFFQPKDYVAEGAVNLHGKDYDDIKAFQMNVKFNQIVGVISKPDEIRFKRTVFRVTKGNVWINMVDIDEEVLQAKDKIIDAKDQHKIIRVVFVVVYPGGFGSNIIKNKLRKICEAFGTANYQFPENSIEYQKSLHDIEAQINETNNVSPLILTPSLAHLPHQELGQQLPRQLQQRLAQLQLLPHRGVQAVCRQGEVPLHTPQLPQSAGKHLHRPILAP